MLGGLEHRVSSRRHRRRKRRDRLVGSEISANRLGYGVRGRGMRSGVRAVCAPFDRRNGALGGKRHGNQLERDRRRRAFQSAVGAREKERYGIFGDRQRLGQTERKTHFARKELQCRKIREQRRAHLLAVYRKRKHAQRLQGGYGQLVRQPVFGRIQGREQADVRASLRLCGLHHGLEQACSSLLGGNERRLRFRRDRVSFRRSRQGDAHRYEQKRLCDFGICDHRHGRNGNEGRENGFQRRRRVKSHCGARDH